MLQIENELISYKIEDIVESNNLLLDSSHQILINAIILSYSLNENINEKTIQNLKNNQDLQIYLLYIIQTKMKNIITDNSCFQFNEILLIINLLTFGNNYKVFSKYNNISEDIFKNILSDYEDILNNAINLDDKSFNIFFTFYITLLDCFIQICIINSIDIKYKKNILLTVNLIQESINNLKSIKNLKEPYVDILNKVYVKSLLFFSSTKYINTSDYTVDTLIYLFEQKFRKHIDGYDLIKTNKNTIDYKTFLLTTTKLLLLMLKKLDTYNETYFYKLNIILKLYNTYFFKDEKIFKGCEDLKTYLLEKFVFIYDIELDISYKELLDLILEKKQFSYNDIIMMHDLVLFDNNLKKDILIKTLKRIIYFKQENNDYYENYRLKIIDILLNKFIQLKIFEQIDEDIHLLISYINNIKYSSHLIASCSKIHLTISLYYSFLNKDYLLFSKKHYFISQKMYSFDYFQNEYSSIFENILLNNANNYLENNLIQNNTLKKDLYTFANKLMEEFHINEDNFLNNQITSEVLGMIQDILSLDTYSSDLAKKDLCELLSRKIFFSICECKIIKSSDHINKIKNNSYETRIQEINTSYFIIYKYSNLYDYNFNKIYDKKQDFIQKLVNTLTLLF